MAPLTWRNVDAPSFAGVADTLRSSNMMLNSGFDSISRALGSFQRSRTDQESNALMSDALRYQDPNAFRTALESGTLLSGRNMANISPESLDFLAKQRNNLISNIQNEENINSTRLNQRSLQTSIDGRNFENERARVAATRQDDMFAAQPEAARLLASIRDDASSGDPERMARAREMTRQNTDVLVRAGMSPQSILGIQEGNTGAFTGGMATNRGVAENQDYFTERFRREGARGLLDAAITNFPTAQSAIDSIQSNPNIDAQTKRQVVNDLRENGNNYFQSMNPVDALLSRAITGSGPANISSNNSPLPTSFQNAVRRTEGAGSPDTLYGHAQKGSGPLGGVSVSNMTIGQAIDFARPGGQYANTVKNQIGRVATPMGKHQIVGSTLRAAAQEMGLNPNTPFNEQTQDAIAQHLALKRINSSNTMEGKIAALRSEWEGFKNVPNAEMQRIVTDLQNGTGSSFVNASTDVNSFNGSPNAYYSYGQAPVDPNKAFMINPDGSISTEQTITIGEGDDYINIPTIVQGMPVSEAEAIELYESGQNDAVGRFKSQKEAEDAAQQRTDELSKLLAEASVGAEDITSAEGQANQTQLAPVANPQQSTQQITDQILQGITPDMPSLQNSSTTIANTRRADAVYDRDRNFRQNIRENPFSGMNRGQIADQLKERGLTDIPRQRVLDLLDQYSRGPDAVSPEAAAAAIEASYGGDTRGVGRRFVDNIPLVGTIARAISPTDNINTEEIDRLLDHYVREDGNPNINTMVGALDQASQAAGVIPTVEQVQTIAAQAEQEFLQAAAAARNNPNIDVSVYRDRYIQAQQLLNQLLQQAAGRAQTYTPSNPAPN